MSEATSVEKAVTAELLETGHIILTDRERERLGLGEHSDAVLFRLGNDEFNVEWAGRLRRLSGDELCELLQETAQIGWNILLAPRPGGGLDCRLTPPRPSVIGSLPARAAPRVPPRVAPVGLFQRAKRRSDRYRLRTPDEYEWTGKVGILKESMASFRSALANRGWDPEEALRLRLEGERLATLDAFEDLLSFDVVHVDRMDHQEAAVAKVLKAMRGRGILADEVGLGKTIEAGLIMKELSLRGLAERVLILCPATLRNQWREELSSKFDEEFTILLSSKDHGFDGDRLIMSHELALRNHTRIPSAFDVIVIDEAHRLAGQTARKRREVFGPMLADARYALLLTATPVQNDLLELHRLVELLRPGTFRSAQEFKRTYVSVHDPRRPRAPEALRQLVSDVMVRTTRSQAGLDHVRRMPPRDHGVQLSSTERQLYDMCLHALRSVMSGPADGTRRRALAHRFTASPFAMHRTAIRMAENHPNPEARRVLADIAELAADIPGTTREEAALAQINDWAKEHGRVLVFTQHTDTVTSLQRHCARAGLAAEPFHGGMSAKAKAEAVAAFKRGQAKVLISTDSGAEGQNLQECNCVINYDLPWNPMRVEQRIGRVHRLTQTRDVYIANYFARDTIDEHVYRLLHDKLAMFELLFGQVVTVLGELSADDDSADTFEGRVLDALVASDDAAMRARIDRLGQELVDARQKAQTMVRDAAGLSSWLAQRDADRETRKGPDAFELMPQRVQRRGERQQSIAAFARRWLEFSGASIEHETVGGEFLSARLPADLVPQFDGRDQLHLAFSKDGMAAHSGAEICAAGSEAFEDILRSLRERGDLAGSFAPEPDPSSWPVPAHDASVSLVSRQVLPASDWDGQATWRVSAEGEQGVQRLVTVALGERPPPRAARLPLRDGDSPPAGLSDDDLIHAVTDRSVAVFEAMSEEATAAQLELDQDAHSRQLENIEDQIADCEDNLARTWDAKLEVELENRLAQLNRAKEDLQRRVASDAAVEMRGELVAIEVHGGDDFMVEERWRTNRGVERALTFAWEPDPPHDRYRSDATGEPIQVIAICDSGGLVDADELVPCDVCGLDWCAHCGPERSSAPCALCGRVACARCRPASTICIDCEKATRAPDLDTAHGVGWLLGSGHELLVGQGWASITEPDRQQAARLLLSSYDLADPSRRAAALHARALGLPPDTGAIVVGSRDAAEASVAAAVWSEVDVRTEVEVQPNAGSDVDPSAVALLATDGFAGSDAQMAQRDEPAHEAADDAEDDATISHLLARLRAELPPPSPPAMVVSWVIEGEIVEVTEDGLVRAKVVGDGEGRLTRKVVERGPLRPPEDNAAAAVGPYRPVATAGCGPVGIAIDQIHRSSIATVRTPGGTRTVFLPYEPGVTLEDELGWASHLAELSLPTDAIVVGDPSPAANVPKVLAQPAVGTAVTRTTSERWLLTVADTGGDAPPGRPPEGHRPAAPRGIGDGSFLHPLQPAIASLGNTGPRLFWTRCLAVHEVWEGEGRAERSYVISPADVVDDQIDDTTKVLRTGQPLRPYLDVPSEGGGDIAVDRSGHLHEYRSGRRCSACGKTSCQRCTQAAAIVSCPGCEKPVCVACTSEKRDLDLRTCRRCGDHTCRRCGIDIELQRCPCCARLVCEPCFAGFACATCAGLVPLSAAARKALPEDLAAGSCLAWSNTDGNAKVVALKAPHRSEIAVLDEEGRVVRWVNASGPVSPVQRLAMSLARRYGIDQPVHVHVNRELSAPVPDAAGTIVLSWKSEPELRWAILSRNGTVGSDPTGARRESEIGAVDADRVAARLLDSLGTDDIALPAPAEGTELSRLLEGLEDSHRSPAVAVLDPRVAHRAVVITDRGLEQWCDSGDGGVRQVAPWVDAAGSALPAGLASVWPIAPSLVASASGFDATAHLVRIGSHLALRAEAGGGTRWFSVHSEPADLQQAAVARAYGQEGSLVGVAACAVSSFAPASLLGGSFVSRSIRPAATAGTGSHDAAAASRALALAGATEGAFPSGLPVSADLAAALVERFPDRQPRQTISVACDVEEEWLDHGVPVTLRYRVVPGQDTALVATDDGTGRKRTVIRCRAGHIAGQAIQCRICHGVTCAACGDCASPCAVCGQNACGSCRRETGFGRVCGACDALHRVRWPAKRQIAGAGRGTTVLQGRAGSITVTCLGENEGSWTVRVEDGELLIASDPAGSAAAAYLATFAK